MAIRGLTLSATFEYVSPYDEAAGTPEETRFTCGPLDVFVTTHLFDNSLEVKDGQVGFRTNAANLEAVRFGLKGISNFKDEHGNDIAYATQDRVVAGRKYTVVAEDVLARIPFADVRGMADRIRNYSVVTAAEAKNSEGA